VHTKITSITSPLLPLLFVCYTRYVFDFRDQSRVHLKSIPGSPVARNCCTLPNGSVYIFPVRSLSSGGRSVEKNSNGSFVFSIGAPPLQIDPLPLLPRFEGAFEAKVDAADAWLAAATSVREHAVAKIRVARNEIDKQRDDELARVKKEFDDTVRRASAVRERGERLANDQHEALIRDSHTKYDLSDMDTKIAAVHVEGQEFRELAAVLRSKKTAGAVVQSDAEVAVPRAGIAAAEERTCVICDDNAAELAIVPCGHVCLCAECCDTLLVVGPSCPMCRGVIQSTLKVFL
jgi:hypothetical protein